MAKKGSKGKTEERRSSTAETESKYTVVRATSQVESKHYEELKVEYTTLEEIRHAVRTLPLDNVLPLLQEVLTQFDVQQARDTVLTEWIKTLLLTHTAYFMKLPEVVKKLSNLYEDLDDRLTVYPKLLAMHGRLDLIQSQIDSRNRKEEDYYEEDEEVEDSDNEQQVGDTDEDDIEEEEDDEDDLMEMDEEVKVNDYIC